MAACGLLLEETVKRGAGIVDLLSAGAGLLFHFDPERIELAFVALVLVLDARLDWLRTLKPSAWIE